MIAITIVNVSSDSTPTTGVNKYEVRINKKVICSFEHDRQHDGLAQCLRDAADAVEKEERFDLHAYLTALQLVMDNRND